MKVIDYLVKVANKEADNISIKTNDYFDEFFGSCRYQDIEEGLNSEVEIIKEEKKIPKKFKVHSLGDKDEYGNFVSSPFPTNEELMDKINEIIDYLKSKGE